MLKMLDGGVKGMFCVGQNPAVGSANSKLMRLALAKLDWLVVRDFQPTEIGAVLEGLARARDRARSRAQDIQTEVFFLPAAAHTEKDGNFTNTQRLLQWHHKACEPPGEARSELHWIYHLGKAIREKLAGSADPKDRPILDLTWDYPLVGPHDEPDAEHVLQEISGTHGRRLVPVELRRARGRRLDQLRLVDPLRASTRTASTRRRARSPAPSRTGSRSEWGWAWPKDTRIIYNRASADAEGKPWSERKRYVWWDAEEGKWTSLGDSPDFPPTKAPRLPAARGRQEAWTRSAATSRSSCIPTAAAGCTRPRGWSTGRCRRTTSRRSRRSPTRSTPSSRTRPAQLFHRPENPYHPSGGEPGADVFPFVLTTYRLTEHHTAGGMSRTRALPGRAAARVLLRGLAAAGGRARARARRLGDDRHRAAGGRGAGAGHRADQAAARARPRRCTWSARPYHWGGVGIVTGDSANELLPLALDNNVHISEYKVATCDIRPGRRPRGPARLELVRGVPPAARGSEASDARDASPGLAQLRRARPSRARGSSPTPRCASAARRARSPARSGTRSRCRCTGFTGKSYDNTIDLGADTWRHVAFIEQRCRRAPATAHRWSRPPQRGERDRRRGRRPIRRATASAG